MDNSPPDDALDKAEAQMRRALGLDHNPARVTERGLPISKLGDPHQPKRRQFVRDGDVPVTVVNRSHHIDPDSPNQLDNLRQAVRTHAAARERAERLLDQAQATIRELQTKLARERMAQDEVIGHANADRRASQQALETIRTDLSAEKIARERSEQALRDARLTIINLTEKLHCAQQALTTVKAELAAERHKALEGPRTTIAVPAVDMLANGDEPGQTVRRPVGRPRKVTVVQTVQEPVKTVERGAGRSVAGHDADGRKKVGTGRQPSPKPVRWWLGER